MLGDNPYCYLDIYSKSKIFITGVAGIKSGEAHSIIEQTKMDNDNNETGNTQIADSFIEISDEEEGEDDDDNVVIVIEPANVDDISNEFERLK